MEKRHFRKSVLPFSLCTLLTANFLAGCCINIDGCADRAKYERIEHLSAPITSGITLAVETHVGSISITGADVSDCNITAAICVKASTKEKAKKLAEQVKIKLEPGPDTLSIKVEKPAALEERCLKVDFDITAPRQLNLNCTADVGSTKVSDISGRIRASVDVGKITCKEIAGDVDLKTDVGKVRVVYSETASAICNADIKTDVGKIDFTGPPNLSARLEASTDVGSIKTDLPITLTGEISRKRLKGTIGTGEGNLRFKTNVGSINIR